MFTAERAVLIGTVLHSVAVPLIGDFDLHGRLWWLSLRHDIYFKYMRNRKEKRRNFRAYFQIAPHLVVRAPHLKS
jgi:hypothetical protein